MKVVFTTMSLTPALNMWEGIPRGEDSVRLKFHKAESRWTVLLNKTLTSYFCCWVLPCTSSLHLTLLGLPQVILRGPYSAILVSLYFNLLNSGSWYLDSLEKVYSSKAKAASGSSFLSKNWNFSHAKRSSESLKQLELEDLYPQ